MRIRSWCLACAGALIAQVFALGSLPFEIPQPWDGLWHVLAFSGLTLLLWIATGGRFPALVVAAVMVTGALDELRQGSIPGRSADAFDLFVVLAAAVVTAAGLLFASRGRSCVESSQQ